MSGNNEDIAARIARQKVQKAKDNVRRAYRNAWCGYSISKSFLQDARIAYNEAGHYYRKAHQYTMAKEAERRAKLCRDGGDIAEAVKAGCPPA